MKVKVGKYPKKGGERKYKVKISNHDVFSADVTLAIVILPVLKKLKKAKAGAPLVDNVDVPENLWRSDEAEDWETDDNWQARWDYVLNAMIWSFEQIHPKGGDWKDQFYTGEADFDFVECEELDENGTRLYEMKHGPNHTLEFDAEGHAAYSQRIDTGLLLFGKYFRALWT